MHILVLGAAGMVGRKLTERLLRDGRLGKSDITRMTLQDVVAPAQPAKSGFPVDTVTCDFAVAGAAEKLVADRPDVIFHLAAIVSGEAELDFDKGDTIAFKVTATAPGGEVHFHGYDIAKEIPEAGGSVTYKVPATADGIFEVEMEATGVQIAKVVVQP